MNLPRRVGLNTHAGATDFGQSLPRFRAAMFLAPVVPQKGRERRRKSRKLPNLAEQKTAETRMDPHFA
jgi:hypothetical protein